MNDFVFECRTLREFLWANGKLLLVFVVWRVVGSVVIAPIPVLTQRIIDDAVPERDIVRVLEYAGFGVFMLLVHSYCMYIAVKVMAKNVQVIMIGLRSSAFRYIQRLHFGEVDKVPAGQLLSKYIVDTQSVESSIVSLFASLFPDLLKSIVLVLTLAYINIWTLAFFVVCLPAYAFVSAFYLKGISRSNHEVRKARESLSGTANELISAIKLVRGFGQADIACAQTDEASSVFSRSRTNQMRANQTMSFTVAAISSLLLLFATSFASILVISQLMSIGTLVALAGAMPSILAPINLVAHFGLQYHVGKESYASIRELFGEQRHEQWNGRLTLPTLRGEIRFEDVHFRYGTNARNAVSGINLIIPAGSRVAVVGASGSGKSTLVSLILGLYPPTAGVILIDGIPQSEVDIQWFRQQCSIVMQDCLLLSGTVFDNIAFGSPDANERRVVEAAKIANAWEFIERMPYGLATRVGERGVTLSGGQRQRVALARAILRNPAILILDEATSALDLHTQRVVEEAFGEVSRGRTTITINHGVAALESADTIVVMENGMIVESGSYEKLDSISGGVFRRMVEVTNASAGG